MSDRRHEWISKRAYAIWEEQGRPDGRDAEHWRQAVAERDALERTQASVDGREVLVKFRPKPQCPAMPRHAWGNPSTKAG
ncbi:MULTISPECIES: DUF2934 domain-containing protein [Rhizobium]|uniref:DUF2934 domain-containing protein n=1 Tax=Rhizobium leguminosarum bv. trifolii (strain WSM1325) TaxID=395491 RepID=C6B7G3_RHILS|nr:DUF2934 domain-containing protein [Rhizobium leguminosarum]ACS60021.1 conserved hypothetical protein [Rhizobium leguminosarum bv. trifolii WSM1325]MBY2934490.1 DUF2934 domain-containing protein [Rhizobium leguminosarum]MBY2942867.1 DUF2934 domain-containing protein [Rhizobium leguminosarum]MBY2963463.1 DUF2934 domain-containing protein [Rhizobium leguminosarum]MBY2994188.1 DUF2934 domain-containing protein [Rhizobium leguminosarum]